MKCIGRHTLTGVCAASLLLLATGGAFGQPVYDSNRNMSNGAGNATRFYQGLCWYPFISIDRYDNLHVTLGATYDVGTDLYYTRLRRNLDLGGASATDAPLTLIPERRFIAGSEEYLHYPLNLVDENGAVHVIYEQGFYGRHTNKAVYYVRICGLVGDLDCDEDVDLSDLAALLGVYGVCTGQPGYEVGADFNGNGCVDISDLAALLGNYGDKPIGRRKSEEARQAVSRDDFVNPSE